MCVTGNQRRTVLFQRLEVLTFLRFITFVVLVVEWEMVVQLQVRTRPHDF